MSKQDHIESFVIEMFIDFKHARNMSVGFGGVSILLVEVEMTMGNLWAQIMADLVWHHLLKKLMTK
jgi:hypothetical protein